MTARVEAIDHTADVGIVVRADTVEEAFVAAAEATFDFMLDRSAVAEEQAQRVQVDANGWEDLLVTWLEELLYLFESQGFAMHGCRIVQLTPDHLQAELQGDRFDPKCHDPKLHIKAVTYHQLRAEETSEGFLIQVIFDI